MYARKYNIVADALSRYAYPASSAKEDVSFHGSANAYDEMQKIIAKEVAEGRMVGLIQMGHRHESHSMRNPGIFHILGDPQ